MCHMPRAGGLMFSCTDLDTTITPSPGTPRIEFVLERSLKDEGRRLNGANGMSDIEGKAARVAANECGNE